MNLRKSICSNLINVKSSKSDFARTTLAVFTVGWRLRSPLLVFLILWGVELQKRTSGFCGKTEEEGIFDQTNI